MDYTNLFGKRIDDRTSDDEWKFGWITRTRFAGKDEAVSHTAQFYIQKLKGNAAPYVSRPVFNKYVSGAPFMCEGDAYMLANVFPELAPLVEVHLADTVTGQPMHYVVKAQYWARVSMNVSESQRYETHEPRAAFRRQVIAGVRMDDEAMMAPIFRPICVSTPKSIIFEQYAASKQGRMAKRKILNERVKVFCDRRAESLRLHMEDTLKKFRLVRE